MLPGIIGCMEVCEVIKMITHTGSVLKNKLFTLDLLQSTSTLIDINPDPAQRQIALERFKELG
jgi:molybdopterin/thiamine biosynthesis adenylyltransferase